MTKRKQFASAKRQSVRGASRASINRLGSQLGSQNSSNRDAKVGPHGEVERIVGTPDYLAPELLLGTGHGMHAFVVFHVRLWRCNGLFLYSLLAALSVCGVLRELCLCVCVEGGGGRMGKCSDAGLACVEMVASMC